MLTTGLLMSDQASVAKIQAVIVSQPGVIRQTLQVMLALSPHIEVIGAAAGGLSALNLTRERPPALLIIDSGLPEDEIQALLQQVKQEQPQIYCLVLAGTTQQQQKMLAMGADVTILHSDPVERLVEVLNSCKLW